MTREELNELSIFALREFARRTGVYAPTSKKKEQLINEILEISEGRKQPYIAKTKQGRPPKNYGYPFVETLMCPMNYSSPILQQDNIFEYNNQIKSLTGYVEIYPGKSLIRVLNRQKWICYQLENSLIAEFCLKNGDLVTVEVGGENHNLATSILSVNGVAASNFSRMRADYSQIPHTFESNPLKFNVGSKLAANYGESLYIYGANNIQNSLMLLQTLENVSADVKLYINLSVVDKNRAILDNHNDIEMFITNFTDANEVARKVVLLAVERAKRALEQGKSCIIGIDDVQSVHSLDNEDFQLTKQLMSLTKNGQNGGSITLFAVMQQNRNLDMFEKLADRRFVVDENQLQQFNA